MTEKHSPLPWSQGTEFEDEYIVDADGDLICRVPNNPENGKLWHLDAPLIVRAVNGLPEAIAVLELATKHLAEMREFCTNYKKRPCGDPDAECPISMGEWFSREDLAELDRIDAALTKLKG